MNLLYEYEQKILRTLLKSQKVVEEVDLNTLTPIIEAYQNPYLKAILEVLFLDKDISKEELNKLRLKEKKADSDKRMKEEFFTITPTITLLLSLLLPSRIFLYL